MSQFPLNEYCGWVVPDMANVPAGTVVPANSQFGNHCTFDDRCKFGIGCTFGNHCTFDDRCKFGIGCTFGNHCTFDDRCKFGNFRTFGIGCKFGIDCKFGNHCTFETSCTFEISCTFGSSCKFDNHCTFGNGCKFGSACTLEGVTMIDWLTLGNVDGTGRQVLLVWHADGVLVRAGCFLGTVDEFCAKAEAEGKHRYVRVIRAVAEAGGPHA